MAQNAAKNTAYNSTATYEDVSHQIISSYFIGPQAENLPYFKENIDIILDELRKARVNYFPEDGVRIEDRNVHFILLTKLPLCLEIHRRRDAKNTCFSGLDGQDDESRPQGLKDSREE